MHTQGTWGFYWDVEKSGETNCGVFSNLRPGMAYSVCRAPRYQTQEQWTHDARLISAAPDLLDACAGWLLHMDGSVATTQAQEDKLIGAMRSAIAKATGK